jgi:hypothetical protein
MAAGTPIDGAVVTFTTTAGTLSAASAVTDSAGVARVTLTSTVPASIAATARTARLATFLASATADVQVLVDTLVSVSVSPASPRRGDTATVTVSAMSGGQPASGALVVAFGDGAAANLGNVTGAAVTTTHRYDEEGTFTVTATLTRNSKTYKTAALVEVRGFAPGVDQIDPRQITWLSNSADVGGWAVTSHLTSVDINGHRLCLPHTKAGQWPTVRWGNTPDTQVDFEATPMIVAKVNGQWYGAAFDWFPVGGICKNITPDEFGRDQIRVSPLDESWPGPQSGDLVGFLVSAPSSNRILLRSVLERSNIVLVRWP